MDEHRKHLLDIYHSALDAVRGESAVRRWLNENPLSGDIYVIAIGKAAESMYLGASAVLNGAISAGLVITKHGHITRTLPANVTCVESSHPVADASSLAAGNILLQFINQIPAGAEVLCLVSGGASALVEVLPEGMDADDLSRMNEWLLSSGMDIHRINRVRRAFSRIKGGRLAKFLPAQKTHCLLVSDVIGDDPAIIGSGLLVAGKEGPTGLADIAMPGWLEAYAGLAEPAPSASDACFANVSVEVIATIQIAMQAAASAAEQQGYDVFLHEDLFCCDAESTGKRLAQQVVDGSPVLHIWGGETVVILPENPGRGGRNQHLALSAATVIAEHLGCYLLAAGTDGSDGPTEDTGALVDANTLARASLDNLDAQQCLNRADAGSFLEASGDLIQTGPTGTNVMDLVLGLKTRS